MERYKRKDKGITLVALVVTIIILLILAGITISQLTENGLLKKTSEAKEQMLNAQNEENEILKNYENYLDIDSSINSVETMLKAVGIEKIYDIDQITDNTDNVLDKILENKDATNYIIENEDTFKDKISNSENGMKALVSNERAIYIAMNNEEWRTSILSSQYSNILDENAVKVPNMTSNVNSSGIAFASSEYEPAYKAFLGTSAGNYGWNSTNGPSPMYVGYDFGKKLMIYKVCVQGHNNWLYDNWKVQAYSDEDSSWYNISDNYKMTTTFSEIPLINYAISSKYRIIREQTPTIICRLQFYCVNVVD